MFVYTESVYNQKLIIKWEGQESRFVQHVMYGTTTATWLFLGDELR